MLYGERKNSLNARKKDLGRINHVSLCVLYLKVGEVEENAGPISTSNQEVDVQASLGGGKKSESHWLLGDSISF